MNKKTFQQRLLISTALPIAIVTVASPAHARDVVVAAPVAPATSVPGSAVNAAIVAAISAPNDANLKVTVPTTGVVTGSTITLNPGEGQGDGKVEFTNEGRIGAVDATSGTVTDSAGAAFNGRPLAGASNTFTGTNSGLIAGGLRAVNFGGAVTFTNAGQVHNGITATGRGDVAVTTTAAGAVRSGSVIAASNTDAATTTANGITTTTLTGGKVAIVQAGDVADANDDVRGNVNASGLGGADINVSAQARAVSAAAGGIVQTVSGSNTVVDGARTTTTNRNDTTLGGGAAKIAIGQDGDVFSASASSVGGASVNADGIVEGSATASSNGSSTTFTGVNVVEGANTSNTTRSTSTAVGKTAEVLVGATGSIGGTVTATGQGGATATVNGAVDGSVSLASNATNTVTESAFSTTATGSTFTSSSTGVAAGGAARGSVGAAGRVEGNVTANGDASVGLANAGVIEGAVSGTSRRVVNSTTGNSASTTTSSATLNQSVNRNASTSRSTTTTGTASFANAASGRVEGGVSLNAGGDVTYDNAGVVFRATNLTSQGSDVVSTTTGTNTVSTAIATPPALNTVTTTIESRNTSATNRTGGNVTGTYANSNGTLNFGVNGDGSVNQVADKASRATVSGVVYGRVNSQAGSANTETSSESRSVQVLTGGNGTRNLNSASNSKSTTNTGGDSSVTVSGKLARGQAGIDPTVFSTATGNSTVAVSGSVEGNVTSQAYAYDITNAATSVIAQRITSGVARTDNLAETSAYGYKAVGGSATVDIAATG
ncbi:MAG: hypothetical protein ABW210_14425, partial [Achromobacter sp.]